MNIEDFISMSEEYDIREKIVYGKEGREVQGLINYNDKIIYLNPAHNEKGLTYTHELMHHYMDNVLCVDNNEIFVEREAELFYNINRELVDSYLEGRLK